MKSFKTFFHAFLNMLGSFHWSILYPNFCTKLSQKFWQPELQHCLFLENMFLLRYRTFPCFRTTKVKKNWSVADFLPDLHIKVKKAFFCVTFENLQTQISKNRKPICHLLVYIVIFIIKSKHNVTCIYVGSSPTFRMRKTIENFIFSLIIEASLLRYNAPEKHCQRQSELQNSQGVSLLGTVKIITDENELKLFTNSSV